MTDTLIADGQTQNAGANQDAAAQAAAQSAEAAKAAAATDPAKAAADAAAAKAVSDAAAAKAKEGERVVPEKYEFKFEGENNASLGLVDDLGAIAKELKLTQAEAQKVADLGPKLGAKILEAQQKAHTETIAQWATDAKNDKDLGGANLDANVAIAKKALDQFGTPALKQMLNETGLGNHPEIIRAFVKAGKAISEDNRHVLPSGGATPPQELAARMFPNQNRS